MSPGQLRTQGALPTSVVAVDVLLSLLGSGVAGSVDERLTVLEMEVPTEAALSTQYEARKVATSPFCKPEIVQVVVPVPSSAGPVQLKTGPDNCEKDFIVVLAGT